MKSLILGSNPKSSSAKLVLDDWTNYFQKLEQWKQKQSNAKMHMILAVPSAIIGLIMVEVYGTGNSFKDVLPYFITASISNLIISYCWKQLRGPRAPLNAPSCRVE